jgi:hypothetical protein
MYDVRCAMYDFLNLKGKIVRLHSKSGEFTINFSLSLNLSLNLSLIRSSQSPRGLYT